MIFDVILLSLVYLLSLFSIAGFGKLTTIYLGQKKIDNLFELFFIGLIFLLLLGFFNYIFFGYSKYSNLLILLFGLCFYFYYYKINLKLFKKIILPSLLLLGIFISKTHEDFHLYHYQHLKELTDGMIKFGMANLDSFVRYSYSSMFSYVQGFFYLPYFELKLFYVPVYLVYVALCSFLYDYKNEKIEKKIIFFSIVVLLVLLIKFTRLSEYGYDYISQFVLIFIFFQFFKKSNKANIIFVCLFFVFALAIKVTSIFFLPIIFYLLIRNKSFLNLNIKSKTFLRGLILSGLTLFIIFANSFLKTGCFFYGLKNTCFSQNKISWVVNYSKIEEHREIASKWAKGFYHTGEGAFQKENPKEVPDAIYGWTPFWLKNHFKNKILDFVLLIGLCFLCIFWTTDKNFLRLKKNEKSDRLQFFWASFVSLFFWFSLLPQYRFGFSIIIFLIFSTLFLFIGNINKFNFKKINFFILISILIFNTKSIDRIYSEFNRVDAHRYSNFPWFSLPERNFETKKFSNSNDLFYVPLRGTCFNIPTPCAFRANKIIIEEKTFLRKYITISNAN
tara:strand:+ start:1921 stop:3600 length:1680 start_codon:yes stop_codon:yes gene_type:complete